MKREPLLHFLLIGAALFLLHRAVSPERERGEAVVITQGVVDDILRQYQGVWNRPPTAAEMQSLLAAHVRDEIGYREGMVLGLDRTDGVVRRRVRQQFELLVEEEVAAAPPDDAVLNAFLQANPARYAQPAVVSFEQVLLGDADEAAVRRSLLAGLDPAEMGQASFLPARVTATPVDLVAREFGEAFAAAVASASVGDWGPVVTSGYGRHLLRVAKRTAPSVPPLEAVRMAVARDFEQERRSRATEARYAALRAKYPVVIEAALPPEARP